MQKPRGFHILRVGLAVTFLWIGVLILKDPVAWSGYLEPWVLRVLPVEAVQIMIATAFFDIVVGILLLIDVLTWVAAIAATIHLIGVLIVSGINDITIRDVGLLAGSISLLSESLPLKFLNPKN